MQKCEWNNKDDISCRLKSKVISPIFFEYFCLRWGTATLSLSFRGARASRGQAALTLCEAPVPILFYIFFSSDLSSVNMSDCDFSWLMPTVSLTAVFFPSPGFLSWILPLPLAQYSWLMHTFSCWQSFLLFQGFSWIFISIGLFRVISL